MAGEDVGMSESQPSERFGADVKEPAVKTLNSVVGAMAVDVLLNQYTQRQGHFPIWVYENNLQFAMYPDHDSVRLRQKVCYFCT